MIRPRAFRVLCLRLAHDLAECQESQDQLTPAVVNISILNGMVYQQPSLESDASERVGGEPRAVKCRHYSRIFVVRGGFSNR